MVELAVSHLPITGLPMLGLGALRRTLWRAGLLAWLLVAPYDGAAGKSPIADGYRMKWVNGRVNAIRPTAADKVFDTIGWVPQLEQALALAQQHHRPVFLFTHSGHMNHGRC